MCPKTQHQVANTADTDTVLMQPTVPAVLLTWRSSLISSPPPSLLFLSRGASFSCTSPGGGVSTPPPVFRCRQCSYASLQLPQGRPCLVELTLKGLPPDKQSLYPASRSLRQAGKNNMTCVWQKKVANAKPQIFNTLRVICLPITRPRFSAT